MVILQTLKRMDLRWEKVAETNPMKKAQKKILDPNEWLQIQGCPHSRR